MRVVIAVHGTHRYSGIPKWSFLLARHLSRKGAWVKVIVDSADGMDKLHEVCGYGNVSECIVGPPADSALAEARFSYNLAQHILKHDNFDILQSSHVDPYCYLLEKSRKKVAFHPFGNELFTLDGNGLNTIYCMLAQPILAACGHRADVLMSEGEFQHRDMAKWYRRPADSIRVLPVGIDTQSLPIKRDYHHHSSFRIIAVNGLFPYEDMDILITEFGKAIAVNPNMSLTIVGNGPERNRLGNLAIGLPIRFEHDLTQKELNAFMVESDAFVCLSRETDYQMGLMEAMAIGLPILSAFKPWLPPEAVLCTRDCLHTEILRMSRWTENELSEYSATLRKWALGYQFDAIADRALAIYEEALR